MVSLMTEAQNVTAVEVVDIVASSGDLAYLGRRGKEPFGLRWIDPTSGLDRKLASVAGNGTRALGGGGPWNRSGTFLAVPAHGAGEAARPAFGWRHVGVDAGV